MAAAQTELPLPTPLSRLLVAFTIEFDNEGGHLLPHRTTAQPGPRQRPWLVSQVMWANFMQFVAGDGVPLRDLAGPVRITNLAGMQRWGYVNVGPSPADHRPAPPRRDWVVRPTPAGRQAQQIWAPLAGVIEERWRARFGESPVAAVRAALAMVASQCGAGLPPYLPVVHNQMFADPARVRWPEPPTPASPAGPVPAAGGDIAAGDRGVGDDLSVLLARVLLAFTLDFEGGSAVSLPVGANLLRVLTPGGIAVRDLPRLTGVSKEALSMATGELTRRSLVAVEADPVAGRGKRVRLTGRGEAAQAACQRRLGEIEQQWRARFGGNTITELRRSLLALIEQPGADGPRLAEGLRPYPDGWRARLPYLRQTTAVLADPAGALPHYPMVLHRGGWPDGS
ncbi:MAG TPA: MarR family winged helix-turn-helix transcriptional regulator [Streptosporangiaceae bacterium]